MNTITRLLSLLLALTFLLPTMPAVAARGCGLTSGVGTTDVMTSGAIASTVLRSFWVRFKVNAFAATTERILAPSATLLNDIGIPAAGTIQYTAGWTGVDGAWTVPAISTGVYHRLGITYNGGATTNDPVFYVDGTTPTVTEVATPTTALDSATEALLFCNAAAGNRVLDGEIAEFAIWNVILTAGNMSDLMAGVKPDGIGVAPLHYWKFCGDASPEPAEVGAVTVAVTTGTAKQPHPVSNGCVGDAAMGKGGINPAILGGW